MRREKLKDLCTIKSGGTPSRKNKEFYGGQIPWVKISDITSSNGVILETEEYITEAGLSDINNRLFKEGTLLFSMYGTLGETAVAGSNLSTNQAILGINPNDDSGLSSEYLRYWFKYKKRELVSLSRGVALKNLSATIVKEFEIPLSSLSEQKAIVAKLDRAQRLIDIDREMLAKYDELIQSVFLEMFGDPVRNEKGWDVNSFGEHIDILTDYHANGSYKILKKHVKLKDKKDYALMVRTTDLENKNFEDGVKYIDEEAYNFLEKSKVFGNEIIINKIGSAGKVYLMPYLSRPVSLGMNAFLLRFNSSLNRYFIFHQLISDYGENEIQKRVKGAVTKTIRKDAVREIPIIVPPLTLQDEFEKVVLKIGNQKEKTMRSIKKSEELFSSLVQGVFG